MATAYETVIGLEVHAQLLTQSKLFCGCSTAFGSSANSHTCPVCLGLPGSLPTINERAVRYAVRAGLALGCQISRVSRFARKNYFYPDLPKGYQISQYDAPLCEHGELVVEVEGTSRRIGITRIHLEEDAGKNVHGVGGSSILDLNRAGVPLIEIVSEPDLRSSQEAAQYLRALREILLCLGINDGNLEEGSFRCDANVSIRPAGTVELGTRCEIKNLNSFRFVQRAIDAEVARQRAVREAGGILDQETRSFDPDTGVTRTLRSKEDAHDYRYFVEPDLPALWLDERLIEEERAALPELPQAVRRRWVDELGLSVSAAQTLSQHPGIIRFFEKALRKFTDPVKLANFMLTEVLRGAKVHGLSAEFTVTPEQVAELLGLVASRVISGKQAKDVFAAIEGTRKSPEKVVEELGLTVVSDANALEPLCRNLIAAHPQQAAEFRAGKRNILGFFVGRLMKETGGKAEPKLASDTLERLLSLDPDDRSAP